MSDAWRESARQFFESYGFSVSGFGIVNNPLLRMPAVMQKGKLVMVTHQNFAEVIAELIDKAIAGSPRHAYFMCDKPYRLEFIEAVKNDLPEETVAEFLYEAWISMEYPNTHGQRRLRSLLHRYRNHIYSAMDPEERGFWDALPEVIEVYRGLQPKAQKKGLSWTTNLETAQWFANRYSNQRPMVYQATIAKSKVYFATNERGEYEVVVDPLALKDLRLADDGRAARVYKEHARKGDAP